MLVNNEVPEASSIINIIFGRLMNVPSNYTLHNLNNISSYFNKFKSVSGTNKEFINIYSPYYFSFILFIYAQILKIILNS